MTANVAASIEREPALEWSFNPWRERPAAAAVGVVVALGLCAFVVGSGLHWLVTFGLCLVAVGALAPLYAPARCRLDARGAARRGPLGWSERAWSDIRRGRAVAGGLLVSPFSRPNPLDPYRSLFLPFPSHDRDALAGEAARRLELHDLAT